MVDIKTKVELSGPELLKRLRDTVDPSDGRGNWLRKLNDRQLMESYHRLKMGQTVYHVCKVAKEDWKVMKDSSIKSLTRAMQSFRDKAVGMIPAVASGRGGSVQDKKEVSETLKKKAVRIGSKINVLAHLAWAIDIQEERIEMLLEKERKSLPFKHTDNTMRVLLDMYAEYFSMTVKMGIQDEMPKEFSVTVHHEFGKLMKSVGSGGSRVIASLERFMELAKEHSVKMVLDEEDGTYRLEDDKNAMSGAKRSNR